MPAPSDAQVLLQAATWLKWIRDDALDARPALPASTDEIKAAIQVLERVAAAQLAHHVPDEWESVEFHVSHAARERVKPGRPGTPPADHGALPGARSRG